jgi:hypothetical protein
MSSREWWQDFVPAEIARLRGELSAIEHEWWPISSGAEAWEQFGRAGDIQDLRHIPGLDPLPLLDAIVEVRQVVAPVDIEIDPLDWRASMSDRLKHWVAGWRMWRFGDRLLWRQRRFNDAVVRALHAQDRMNRELSAQLLLTLILLGRRQVAPLPKDGSGEQAADSD